MPGTWVLAGLRDPVYLNIEMPFALHAPAVPDDNPTGIYRRTFRVPVRMAASAKILRIGSADSLAIVWINGARVGLGKDSRLPSSFDVSDLLGRGSNELAIVVPQ